MNFFEHQDEARRQTGRLVILFALAVVAIMATIYLIVIGLLIGGASEHVQFQIGMLWNPRLLAAVAVGVGTVILAGSLYQVSVLSSGGKVIAESLGGRLLTTATRDWRERRLLNVVEEMALASGTPVPAVYVMDNEEVINAFAAGFNPTDAVIGVTRGTMNTLTRDELQGVIAHEFSHIFNGDMRLNLRLVGVLHGILLLSLIGYVLIRIVTSARPSSSSRSSNDKKDGGGILIAILLFGVGLYIVGYIGVFFGKLIKSAVSRQREFLADASAVQFTRNPSGIGGALKKIGAMGSRIKSTQAEEASHMFFGNAVGGAFLNLLATHPPLVERVRRIEPTFDGNFSRDRLTWPDEREEKAELDASSKKTGIGDLPVLGKLPGGMPGVAGLASTEAVSEVGRPQRRHLKFAKSLIAELPEDLETEVHDPHGAAAVVCALLLHADDADDEPGLAMLAQMLGSESADRVRRVSALIEPLGPQVRLPLAQLSMSALRQLTPPEFDAFRKALVALIRADRHVSIFEYCLQRMVIKHLVEYRRGATASRRVTIERVDQAAAPIAVLVSALSRAGHKDEQGAQQAAAAGYAKLSGLTGRALMPREACGYSEIDGALDALHGASGDVKRQVLEACAEAISSDGKLTLDEAELLRTVADALDCPMPPPAAQLTVSQAV